MNRYHTPIYVHLPPKPSNHNREQRLKEQNPDQRYACMQVFPLSTERSHTVM